MKSTNSNISNPIGEDPISIPNLDVKDTDSLGKLDMQVVTQDFYDHIQTKDPQTIYIIKDSLEKRLYHGNYLVPSTKCNTRYLIGYDKDSGQYIMYRNEISNYVDNLIPLAKYDTPKAAMDALLLNVNAGSHEKKVLALYSALSAFIDGDVGIHDFIIGVLCLYGFKDDTRLQEINTCIIDWCNAKGSPHTSVREFLLAINNPLCNMYSAITDIIVKYDFFKDDKYHTGIDKLDLEKPINDIMIVMAELMTGQIV